MKDLVLFVTATILPYLWGELTVWVLHRFGPSDDGARGANADHREPRGDVLDFQI